jgi:hypothetical protein
VWRITTRVLLSFRLNAEQQKFIGGWLFSFFGAEGVTGFKIYSMVVGRRCAAGRGACPTPGVTAALDSP